MPLSLHFLIISFAIDTRRYAMLLFRHADAAFFDAASCFRHFARAAATLYAVAAADAVTTPLMIFFRCCLLPLMFSLMLTLSRRYFSMPCLLFSLFRRFSSLIFATPFSFFHYC